jgi:hypothetical protein
VGAWLKQLLLKFFLQDGATWVLAFVVVQADFPIALTSVAQQMTEMEIFSIVIALNYFWSYSSRTVSLR